MMQEFRDPSIRLFGRTIQLAPNYDVSGEQTSDHNNLCSVSLQTGSDKNSTSNESDHHSESKSSNNITADDDEDSSNNNKKPLKKPTKILPCPRCNSTDTKFCYFNNYNVKQPRHFCKDCQRYWTSGGSMRNMPIGSGRRKTKNMTSSSSCHHESQDSLKPASIMAFQPIWPAFGFPVQMMYAPSPYCCWMTPASASNRPNSPLGKHPRDAGNKMEKKKTTSGSESSESSVLVTKTIRFDDPIEAAQSSIWTTLGNKSQKNDNNSTSLDSSVFFGGFDQSKSEETSAASRRMLQANPAALSRALTFQESAE